MNWIIATVAIIGVVLNVRRKWYCFLFWAVSNCWWLIHNICIGEYAQAVLFGVFFIFCFYGSGEWESINAAKKKDVHQQNIIKWKIISLCKGILHSEKRLNRESGRIKINWLLNDTRMILKLLGDDHDKAVDNKNQ